MTKGLSGGTSSQQSTPGSEEERRRSAPARPGPFLDRCVANARVEWDRRYPNAVSDSVLDRCLGEVRAAITSPRGETIPDAVREPASLLGVRRTLLDLIRVEYLRGLDRAEGSPAAHLERLHRFEEVRETLDPEWDEQVEAALSGPHAHRMLAEIGHDLRSPLTSILFLSEVLKETQRGSDSDQKARQLGLIYSGALTMLNIVNNFMELVRTGDRPLDAEPTVFSLAELMESVRRTVQPMADERGLVLEAEVRPAGSDRRVGHPVALSRILLNLGTNALKFTESGRIGFRVEELVPDTFEFSVTDTGPGIEPSQQDAIFNVFEPAQDRAGVRFSGSGLGLVIVRRLLRSMDSELECRSELGEGTRMSFRLSLPEA